MTLPILPCRGIQHSADDVKRLICAKWPLGWKGSLEGLHAFTPRRAAQPGPEALMLQTLDHPASSQKGHITDGSPTRSRESYLMDMYLTTLSDLHKTRVCFDACKGLPEWHLLPSPLISIAVSLHRC
jgi:hypothetical protein